MRNFIIVVLLSVLFAVGCVYNTSAIRRSRETSEARAFFRECLKKCDENKLSMKFCVKYCLPKKVPVEKQNVMSDSNVQSNMPVTSEQLWERYRAELFSFFRQGDPNAMPSLQLVNVPFPAEWDRNPELLTLIADTVPKWGKTWQLGKTSFSSVYGDFLTNINVPFKNIDQTKFMEVDRMLMQSEMMIDFAVDNCDMKYASVFDRASARRQPEPDYSSYEARFCPQVDRAQKMYDIYLYQYEVTQREVFGPNFRLFRAVAKYGQTERKGDGFKYLAYGDLARFAQNAEAGQTNSFEIKVTEKTTSSTKSTFSQSINVGYSGFIGPVQVTAGVNYSVNEMKLKTSLKEFQIIIGAGGYKAIPVTPSRTWFSPEVLEKFRNGPFKKPANYFGPNGQIPMIPKTLIVVVKPSVTMFVVQQDAEEFQRQKELGVNLSVAGITFDFKRGATLETKKDSEKLFQITITGNSPTPQLFALENYIFDAAAAAQK